MPWTSGVVVSKLYRAVDATSRVDTQRLNQWIDILRQRPGDEVFEALLGVFCNADRGDKRFVDQEYAGRILLALKPPCSQDFQAVIKRTLSTWDVSVEQLPWYFSDVIGREAVLRVLDMLDTKECSRQERDAIHPFRFWLSGTRGAENRDSTR
jgi:hypothetical protein